jgi:hypothetical protein
MKVLSVSLIGFLYFVCAATGVQGSQPKHEPRHYVVLCSQGLTKPQKEQALIEFQKFVAGGGGQKAAADKGMVPGDTITIYDASTLNEIASELTIPLSARTGALQLNSGQSAVSNFREFLRRPENTNAVVNVPSLVQSWREKIASTNAAILLIGSPLYHDDVDAHDMRRGWPSDGFFTMDRASSVFSTSDRNEALQGNKIYFCMLDNDIWGTPSKESHREMIKRFWALYFNQCGGHLVSFQTDIPTAFQNLLRNDLQDVVSLESLKIDPADKTMELRTTKFNLIGTKVTTNNVPSHSNIISDANAITGPSASNSPIAASSPAPTTIPFPAPTAPELDLSSVEWSWLTSDDSQVYRTKHPGPKSLPPTGMCLVGLRWGTGQNPPDTDLDLHVKMKGNPQELFWGRQQTPEGQHFKDFTNPDAKNGFEIVVMNVPVNPKDLDVWINTYKGKSPKGFSGEVRVLYSGHRMSYPFTISGNHGTKGDDSPSREQNRAWVRIPTEIPN